ncbi:hypothetical protein [Congregicoccus parvus]|uniref:hypothetical protein n=1 Tax=Congregicoccus parvus TaxID=3081749 RepID=UPI003FA60AF7
MPARVRFDRRVVRRIVFAMTLLELKQQVTKLTLRERRELNAYLIRLRHERPEWKRIVSKRMREMDSGKKVTLEDLQRTVKARG